MKAAVFHDYLDCIGGGEKVALEIARILKADFITTDVDRDVIKKLGFDDIKIISLGDTIKVPPLKQISASFKFARADFSKDYNFFILSTGWSIFAAKKHKPNIYYCHSPVRVFFDLYEIFKKRQSFAKRLFFVLWAYLHRSILKKYARHIEKFLCNSENTKKRIKKYYGRDAHILYPYVDCSKYRYKKNGDFWLSVNRLYPEKRVEMQIEVFRRLPNERLIIIGGYARGDHAEKYLNKITYLPNNIEIKGQIGEKELIELYANCKAFITTALDEDFGITPLEAMASGKPVVAVNQGGYKETVIDGKTGKLVKADVDELIGAVKEIRKNPKKYRKDCEKQAEKFDLAIFTKKLKEEINKQY